MHFRMPSMDHGVVSFLWGLGFAVFVWAGLLSVGVSKATSVIIGALAGGAVFLLVRLYGEEDTRRLRRKRGRGA